MIKLELGKNDTTSARMPLGFERRRGGGHPATWDV
jgi:hypothetical protein